jgi:hypothetical protein
LGVERFLVARAIENEAELRLCCEATSSGSAVVCRLTVSVEEMKRRVKMREPGIWQQKYVARVEDLNAILDRVKVEDFSIQNERHSLTEVAMEMLFRAGWIRG